MEELKIGKLKVRFYSDASLMPILKFKDFQKYCLLESGLGSSFGDIQSKLEKLAMFVNKDLKGDSIQEINNIREACFYNLNGVNLKHLSFACLIESINGEAVKNTKSDLEEALSLLNENGLTQKVLEDSYKDLKKK